jgi:ribosomal-protein-alanine N-acetyltransferase
VDVKIETKRLLLKNYRLNDLDNIFRLKSEPLVWKFSTKAPTNNEDESKEYLENVLKSYIENKHDFQALFLKHTQEYIGEAGIISFNKKNSRAIVGYNLLPKYWNNGYATEITEALVKYSFDNEKVERIEALAVEENRASRKVLEKSGFVLEGLLRNFAYIDNRYFNVCYYGMIRQDYER